MISIAHAAIRLPTQLVPCGTSGTPPCNPCHLWALADNLINFALWMSLPILVIALLFGGALLLLSAGSEERIKRGKAIMFNALVGILIAFLAWLIVDSIIKTLAAGKPVAAWNTMPLCGEAAPPPPTTPPPPPPPIVGLSCNSQNQCVQGGGGKTCSRDTDCVALQCSASSVSPLIQAVIDCTLAEARRANLPLVVTSVNTGRHTCDLSRNPPNISCHYGGTLCNGVGHAADFGLTSGKNAANWSKAVQIVASCGGRSARCETSTAPYITSCSNPAVTHVHTNSSQNCGCN